MARNHPPFTPEFRRQMIELVRSGRSPESLANEFEPTAQTIRNWVAQAGRDAGERDDGTTTTDRAEINRLRRENRQLKVERDILSKAAAWFARETDVIPPKGSDSLAPTRPFFRLPRCAVCWAFQRAAFMRGASVRRPGAAKTTLH